MKDYFPTTILILQEPLYNQSIDKLLLTDHTLPCSDVFCLVSFNFDLSYDINQNMFGKRGID